MVVAVYHFYFLGSGHGENGPSKGKLTFKLLTLQVFIDL